MCVCVSKCVPLPVKRGGRIEGRREGGGGGEGEREGEEELTIHI